MLSSGSSAWRVQSSVLNPPQVVYHGLWKYTGARTEPLSIAFQVKKLVGAKKAIRMACAGGRSGVQRRREARGGVYVLEHQSTGCSSSASVC